MALLSTFSKRLATLQHLVKNRYGSTLFPFQIRWQLLTRKLLPFFVDALEAAKLQCVGGARCTPFFVGLQSRLRAARLKPTSYLDLAVLTEPSMQHRNRRNMMFVHIMSLPLTLKDIF